jgi:hypothetical protein
MMRCWTFADSQHGFESSTGFGRQASLGPPAADRSRGETRRVRVVGEGAAWPRQSYPLNPLERACPKASLGPSRPSFIDEVHAGGTAGALSQVRIQNNRHLGSEPAPHEVIL